MSHPVPDLGFWACSAFLITVSWVCLLEQSWDSVPKLFQKLLGEKKQPETSAKGSICPQVKLYVISNHHTQFQIKNCQGNQSPALANILFNISRFNANHWEAHENLRADGVAKEISFVTLSKISYSVGSLEVNGCLLHTWWRGAEVREAK